MPGPEHQTNKEIADILKEIVAEQKEKEVKSENS